MLAECQRCGLPALAELTGCRTGAAQWDDGTGGSCHLSFGAGCGSCDWAGKLTPEQHTMRASVFRWRRSSRGRCTRRWPPCIAGTMLQRGPRKSIQECTGNRWQLPQCTGTRWQLPQCTGTRGSYPSATDGSYPSALVTDGSYPSALVTDGSDPSLFEIRTENPNESVLEWASVCADCLYV